jgi:electron transport complex protein RnfE
MPRATTNDWIRGNSMSNLSEFTKGIWRENPLLRLLLGTCPSLGVTSEAINGLGMGLCTTAVLLGSNLVISLIRNQVPPKVRIPCFIIVIATFVTIVSMFMEAFVPALFDALGIFIPLIVVNCIILGRAEAFASRRGMLVSGLDGLGMGLGFTLALVIIGSIRELLGNGTLFGAPAINGLFGMVNLEFEPVLVMILAPGAFITVGFLLATMNKIDLMKKRSASPR